MITLTGYKSRQKQRSGFSLVVENVRFAKQYWRAMLHTIQRCTLESLTHDYALSVPRGELWLLDGKWYVTHAGLLRLARRRGCRGIRTNIIKEFCDPAADRWVFKATVYKSPGSKGFVGYGDADPSNVSALVRGAEMRVAETRAVNRALRKAYGIGLCSVEELGSLPSPLESARKAESAHESSGSVSGNGQPRLRDRLCQLIRQYSLDPTLVKRYAANFCATNTLREASRDMVESFIQTLAEWAAKDRPGLLCHLNSYAEASEAEVKS